MTYTSYSISNSSGKISEYHSRRTYTPFSAEKSLADRNIVIYDCGDDRKHLNDVARSHIQAYNDKQKRNDRKKAYVDDYVSALESGIACYGKGEQREKPFHHDVIQVGNRENLGVTDADFDVECWRMLKREERFSEAAKYVKAHLNNDANRILMKQILVETMQEVLQECNPGGGYSNILVHGIVIHDDEPNGTCHCDMRYSIFTDGEKQGLSWRISDHKGLMKMGFRTDATTTALQKFRESVNARIEEKMLRYGIQREVKNEHRKHLSSAQYEAMMKIKSAEKQAEEIINASKIDVQRCLDEIADDRVKLNEAYMQYQTRKIELIDTLANTTSLEKNLSDFLKSDIGKKALNAFWDTKLDTDELEINASYEETVPKKKHAAVDKKVQNDEVMLARTELNIPADLDEIQAVKYVQEHLNDDFDNEDELYAKHKKKMPKSDLSSKAIRHNDINFKINDVDEKYYGQEISR